MIDINAKVGFVVFDRKIERTVIVCFSHAMRSAMEGYNVEFFDAVHDSVCAICSGEVSLLGVV